MLINLRDPIYRLRSIALIEGFSFLLLLFVSMPLKYYMGMRGFSFYVGALHGALFVIYIFVTLDTIARRRLNIIQFIRVIIASVVPFGTFFNDNMLKNLQEPITKI